MTTTVLSEKNGIEVLQMTGSASAINTNLIAGECFLYRSVAMQITGIGAATTVIAQISNDNTTFVSVNMKAVDTTFASVVSLTAVGNYLFKTNGFRYFRIRTSAYLSGTVSATAILSSVESSNLI